MCRQGALSNTRKLVMVISKKNSAALRSLGSVLRRLVLGLALVGVAAALASPSYAQGGGREVSRACDSLAHQDSDWGKAEAYDYRACTPDGQWQV
jgi:hypothetical protein